ncbi:MAG: glutathione synthase [Myxococcota bacterium]
MGMTFVFLMDPIERIDIDGDSTFVLMLASQTRGHKVLYAHPKQLELRGDKPWVVGARPLTVRRKPGDFFELGAPTDVGLNDVDAVFMRKDPPFDLEFLMYTYVLDRVDRRSTVLVNDPQGLRDFNEKLAALYWPELMPPTLITADRSQARAFIRTHDTAVVKPLNGAGGAGILLLTAEDRNVGSALDILTQDGRTLIEVQAFIPAVDAGDKRVVLLDGEPIGAVNRVPSKGDIRANMHVGGRAEASTLTDRDREIAAALAPELVRRGLILVGIDIIGGFLTEINVTSPTGLQEIDRFNEISLEDQVVERIEEKRNNLR